MYVFHDNLNELLQVAPKAFPLYVNAIESTSTKPGVEMPITNIIVYVYVVCIVDHVAHLYVAQKISQYIYSVASREEDSAYNQIWQNAEALRRALIYDLQKTTHSIASGTFILPSDISILIGEPYQELLAKG